MYEYANRLAKKGYTVHLTYPVKTPYMNYRLPYPARYILSKIEGFDKDKWFDFDPSITMSYVPEVKDKYIIDADVVIATWWSTAAEMGKLSPQKGQKINLIQGYENWEGNEDLLFKSYDMEGVTNIVVASYLKKIVEQHTDKKAILIENAIDSEKFHITMRPEERYPASVAMTYSTQEIKGSEYGLQALKIAKEKNSDLIAELFGICPQPEGLPDWIRYYRDPKDLNALYNRNAIFISNSLTEGFPLTPAESLFCGCALICTDIDGHKEFAIDYKTALLVEPKNAEQMAEKILHIISTPDERMWLAHEGNKYISRFSWDNAVEKMDTVIKNLITNK